MEVWSLRCQAEPVEATIPPTINHKQKKLTDNYKLTTKNKKLKNKNTMVDSTYRKLNAKHKQMVEDKIKSFTEGSDTIIKAILTDMDPPIHIHGQQVGFNVHSLKRIEDAVRMAMRTQTQE